MFSSAVVAMGNIPPEDVFSLLPVVFCEQEESHQVD
jgi:hypothetical protein